MKKYLFIVNPVSGYFKKKSFLIEFENLVRKNYPDSKIELTTELETGFIKAKNLGVNYDILVAVGGDGTCHEVLNACTTLEKPLAIIPTGTGNMVARTLKIPLDFKKVLYSLKNFEEKDYPLGYVSSHDRYFLLHTGLGIEAQISEKELITKKRRFHLPLHLDYFFKIWKILKNPPKYDIYYQTDVTSRNLHTVTNLSVCNLTFLKLEKLLKLPKRDIWNFFEIIWTKDINIFQLLRCSVGKKHFENEQAKEISILTPYLKIQADGEIIGNTPAKIVHTEKKITILSPNF